MIYNIKEKNVSLSDFTREKIKEKIDRVEKLFSPETVVSVKLSSEKHDYKVEITIPIAKRYVRAEVTHDDLLAALDKAVDIIEGQIVKHKGRMKSKVRKNVAYKNEYEAIPISEDILLDQGNDIVIERDKRFELMPMDIEEAVMQMELLGHLFFVFLNLETDTVSVVYKRKNGTYGLISQEK